MSLLIVETVEIQLDPAIVRAVKEELEAGGLAVGMFYVGGIRNVPDMIYLLWHLAGEVPVSTMIARETMSDVEAARAAVQDFLLRWNQRAG